MLMGGGYGSSSHDGRSELANAWFVVANGVSRMSSGQGSSVALQPIDGMRMTASRAFDMADYF